MKPILNWKRFSLRTLFVLMTLCCLLFGTWAAYVNPYRLQMQSLAAVNRLQGNSAKTPAKGPGWHRWLVTSLLGDEAFVRVTEVDLAGKKINDNDLRQLGGLIYLEKLSLDYTPITDGGVATLRLDAKPEARFAAIHGHLRSGRRAPGDAAALAHRVFDGAKITDAGADYLANNKAMEELYIRWTQITDEGADRLAAALPECAIHHHALLP